MLLEAQQSALAANIILPVLAIAAVFGRLAVLHRTQNGYGASEYIILLALVIAVADCALGIYGVSSGIMGVSLRDLAPEKFQNYLLMVFLDILLCHLVYGLVKVSTLFFYKHVFPTKTFRLHANIVIVVVVAFTTAITLAQIFGTTPIDKAWRVTGYGRGDFNYNHQLFIVIVAVIDMVLNIWTLTIPLSVIKNLHIDTKKKVVALSDLLTNK